MTRSLWQQNYCYSKSAHNDIVIVGAGYAGLATAYWLNHIDPALKITVLEKETAGAGASGRNAGFLTKGSAKFFLALKEKWGEKQAASIFEFARESLSLVNQHVLQKGGIPFEERKSVTLVRDENEKELNWLRTLSFEWQDQISLPDKLSLTYAGAWINSPEFKINPMNLMGYLKSTLISRGVEISENLSAFEVQSKGVNTERGFINGRTILALNGYAPDFHTGFKGFIQPKRAQMLSFEADQDYELNDLYYDPAERVYWRKVHGRTFVIGGKRLADEAHENTSVDTVTAKVQVALESYLSDVLQINFQIKSRWSGMMAFTENELPFVDKLDSSADCYFIGGFSGHGMGLGFHAAREMAEIVLGQRKTSFFSSFHGKKIKL